MHTTDKLAERKIKLLRVCDGLHYSLEMLGLSYDQMWLLCKEITTKASKATEAMQCCWSFIDSMHRLRELAKSIPTVNSKHAEIRAFLGSTEVTEHFRHYVQHLNRELGNVGPSPSPVWGALSWVDGERPNVMYTAFLGTDIAGTEYSGGGWVFGQNRFRSKVMLALNNESLYFDEMFDAAMRFRTFVDDHVKPVSSQMPPQPTGLPVFVYEVTEMPDQLKINVKRGLVVEPGTTVIRAPKIKLQAELASGQSLELRTGPIRSG